MLPFGACWRLSQVNAAVDRNFIELSVFRVVPLLKWLKTPSGVLFAVSVLVRIGSGAPDRGRVDSCLLHLLLSDSGRDGPSGSIVLLEIHVSGRSSTLIGYGRRGRSRDEVLTILLKSSSVLRLGSGSRRKNRLILLN